MMGRMMGSPAPSVAAEMSVLHALARLLDPDAGPEADHGARYGFHVAATKLQHATTRASRRRRAQPETARIPPRGK